MTSPDEHTSVVSRVLDRIDHHAIHGTVGFAFSWLLSPNVVHQIIVAMIVAVASTVMAWLTRKVTKWIDNLRK